MIGTHDSYTYQKPINFLLYLIRPWWKCQDYDIKTQYEMGVRVFDVRIYRNKDKWGTGHGFVHFKESFNTISEICEYFKTNYPDAFIRIFLEDNVRGKFDLQELFLNEAKTAFNKYKNMLWEIGTHFPWKTYYKNKNFNPQLKEYACHLFNWNTDQSIKYNLKNLDWSSWLISKWAKKHNIEVTQEMIDDPKVMYFFDYFGTYPKKK